MGHSLLHWAEWWPQTCLCLNARNLWTSPSKRGSFPWISLVGLNCKRRKEFWDIHMEKGVQRQRQSLEWWGHEPGNACSHQNLETRKAFSAGASLQGAWHCQHLTLDSGPPKLCENKPSLLLSLQVWGHLPWQAWEPMPVSFYVQCLMGVQWCLGSLVLPAVTKTKAAEHVCMCLLASWGSSRLKRLLKAFVRPVGLTVHNPGKRLLYVYVRDVLCLCLLPGLSSQFQSLTFHHEVCCPSGAGVFAGPEQRFRPCVSAYGYLVNLQPSIEETALPNCITASPLSTRRAPHVQSLSQTLTPSPLDSVYAVLNHYTVDLGYLVSAQVQTPSMSSRLCCSFLALCISIQILDSVCQFLLNNKKDRIVSISRCTNTAYASIYLGLKFPMPYSVLQCSRRLTYFVWHS